MERIVMLFLNLGNIRYASLFPRDPKSLPRLSAPEQEECAVVSTFPIEVFTSGFALKYSSVSDRLWLRVWSGIHC